MKIYNETAQGIVTDIINVIETNANYLSEIDGATGDGDHGINMKKGFLLAQTRLDPSMTLSVSLDVLGTTLIEDIGGSMGPLYGTFFLELSDSFDTDGAIDEQLVLVALSKSAEEIMDIAGAKEDDKTIIDTILPAIRGLKSEIDKGSKFSDCMLGLKNAALEGAENTKNMVARLGRASRLGERSRGHLDAGAVSCSLIISSMVDTLMSMDKGI